eukprot:scaffold280877_cov19-Tisochrysis_lutea.AAC.1
MTQQLILAVGSSNTERLACDLFIAKATDSLSLARIAVLYMTSKVRAIYDIFRAHAYLNAFETSVAPKGQHVMLTESSASDGALLPGL